VIKIFLFDLANKIAIILALVHVTVRPIHATSNTQTQAVTDSTATATTINDVDLGRQVGGVIAIDRDRDHALGRDLGHDIRAIRQIDLTDIIPLLLVIAAVIKILIDNHIIQVVVLPREMIEDHGITRPLRPWRRRPRPN
jgi:hypothetical protein